MSAEDCNDLRTRLEEVTKALWEINMPMEIRQRVFPFDYEASFAGGDSPWKPPEKPTSYGHEQDECLLHLYQTELF